MSDVILRAIAGGGHRGTKLADIICKLVIDGGQLGELAEYEIPDLDQPKPEPGQKPSMKTCRTLPRSWLDRLVKAIETDAIDHVSIARIVEVLLQEPS
jgi:hypothetical protein